MINLLVWEFVCAAFIRRAVVGAIGEVVLFMVFIPLFLSEN